MPAIPEFVLLRQQERYRFSPKFSVNCYFLYCQQCQLWKLKRSFKYENEHPVSVEKLTENCFQSVQISIGSWYLRNWGKAWSYPISIREETRSSSITWILLFDRVVIGYFRSKIDHSLENHFKMWELCRARF